MAKKNKKINAEEVRILSIPDPTEQAAEASRSMRSHSTIPLGKQGLMDHPRHQKQSAYQQEFKWWGPLTLSDRSRAPSHW